MHIQTCHNGTKVCYFKHNGKECLWKERNGERLYSVFYASDWYEKDIFYNLY